MRDLQPWEAVTTSDGKHGTIVGAWYNDNKEQIGWQVRFHNGQKCNYTYDGVKSSAINTYATPEQVKHDLKRLAELERNYMALLYDVKQLRDELQNDSAEFMTSPSAYGEGAGKAFKIAADRLEIILIGRG
jgi:hypothetical protein